MKEEKAAVVAVAVGDEWQCRKHPTPRSGGGVCPFCLRDRLLRLCPTCTHVRPCACASACASPSSSSSGDAAVHSLIERDHRIARSRSVAAGSSAAFAAAAVPAAVAGGGERRKARVWGWPPFRKSAASAEGPDEDEGLGLPRSSSVSATAVESKTAAAAVAARAVRWGWHFTSPLKAFRHRRSAAAAVAGRA